MERAPLISIVLLALLPISITAQESQQPRETRSEAVPSYEEATSRTESTAGFRTLQKIGLAFHGYHDIFGRFPPAVLYGPDGKTPYSWRVELLPVLKHYAYQIDPQTDSRLARRTMLPLLHADMTLYNHGTALIT